MTTSTMVIVGGIATEVEVLNQRITRHVAPNVVEAMPIQVADWPITAAEIERLSNEVFVNFGCTPERGDIVWAINKAGFAHWKTNDRYVFGAVATSVERHALMKAALEQAKDGLV